MAARTKLWRKIERRKYPRVNVLFPVHYGCLPKVLRDKDIKPTSLGICRNISGGGLLLEVTDLKEEMLLCDNFLKLEIRLEEEEEPIDCFARLVKAGRSLTQDSYYLRLCFVHIEDTDREKIIEFTNKCLSKGKR